MLRNGFETRLAAHQNSIDIFKDDWGSAFPATTGLQAGASNNFEDVRVPWAAAILGGLNGRSVVELGPFEAYNTWQLQVAGAASVLAIEGSQINFLKCLVVKNILGLNATFMHGDFIAFLERTGSRYDICWASGVLYHMTDPLSLLRGIRKVSDIAFIWTHYFDEAALRASNSIEPFQAERNIRIDAFDRGRRLFGEPIARRQGQLRVRIALPEWQQRPHRQHRVPVRGRELQLQEHGLRMAGRLRRLRFLS